MSEGHARPIMMLRDKPDERDTLFKEVIYKKLTVREAEKIALFCLSMFGSIRAVSSVL